MGAGGGREGDDGCIAVGRGGERGVAEERPDVGTCKHPFEGIVLVRADLCDHDVYHKTQ